MNILLEHISRRKLAEIFLSQDPNPDVFKRRIWIQPLIIRIRNTAYMVEYELFKVILKASMLYSFYKHVND
jgi:hypothetical protein